MMGLRQLSGWRASLAAFGLGLLSALSFPPLHVIPALVVAVPGLLALIEGASGRGRGFWTAAGRGYWFGFGMHLVGLYWITEAILLESARYWWLVPLAVPALSALMALFVAAPCGVAKLVPAGWRRVAMLGGAWVISEFGRQYFGTGFPWNPWGSVWTIPGGAGDVMMQPAAWVGTPGLTLATVLLAGMASLGWRAWCLGGVVLVGWAGAGVLRLREPVPVAPGIVAVLVQGNVTLGAKSDRTAAMEVFGRHLRLSSEGVAAAGGRPSVVIWPESSSVFALQSDAGAREAIAQAVAPALGSIVGSLTFRDEHGQPTTPAYDVVPFNSMVAMDKTGAIDGIYDKWHLVPFGEFPPSWVPLAIQIVPGHFGFGTGPGTLRIPGLPPFGGLICYEAIFPAQVVDEADRPAWLVNITNDAWFGNSTGPRQHLAGARLRAVEEGLPLMRAANTGITAGFDAWGRELGRLPMGSPGVLNLELPGARGPTLFARYGLWIPGVLAFLSILTGLYRKYPFVHVSKTGDV